LQFTSVEIPKKASLKHVRPLPANNSGRRACAALSHPDPKADGFANIAPSQKVLTIRFNRESQQRSLDALQWGLIPYWAKDPRIAYKTINARVETIDTAPSYRQAFKKRRCLIPADGFYEWRKTAKPKLPFAIAMKDGRPFTFAGLWENWKDPESGEWLRTCTIITGEPNELVADPSPYASDSS
jgi:putative SOS response-associated peptidase YedK